MSSRRGHAVLRLTLATVFSWLAAGCGAPEPSPEAGPIRLVDPARRAGAHSLPASLWTSTPDRFPGAAQGAAGFPRATIHDDTRYVLAAHPRHVLAARKEIDPVASGVVIFREPLGDRFAGVRRVFIDAQVWIDALGRWRPIPPFIHELEERAGERSIELRLEAAGAEPGAPVALWVEAIALPAEAETSYETAELVIPEAARLDFSLGILEAAASLGPVSFSIDTCRAGSCEPLFSRQIKTAPHQPARWRSGSVELAELAGQHLSLRFRAIANGPKGVSLPVWANPILVTGGPPPASRPNLILLSIDTLRRDHLEAYGYAKDTSPFMASTLSKRGAILDDLVSEAATTDPSHMTLFTSLPAMIHGISCCSSRIDVPAITLAEAFRRENFATAAFTENGPLDHEVGFAIGFDRWVENKSAHSLLPSGQVKRVFDQAKLWLQKRDERPFFLFLHSFQVHGPYTPEGSYKGLFADDPPGQGGPEALDYDREIRLVDDELARLFGWLDAQGLSEDTIFVILSDHGEEFYEHGSLGHATLPYEPVLNVPLIIVGPGISPGLRSNVPLHHVDIMPTLLELAGIAVPAPATGRSFAPLLRGEASPTSEQDEERARISVSWVVPPGFEAPAATIRRADLKLIRYGRGGEVEQLCFDLARDPAEQRSVCEERRDDFAKLEARLERFENDALAQRSVLQGREASPVRPAGSAPLDPEREAELRALGYID